MRNHWKVGLFACVLAAGLTPAGTLMAAEGEEKAVLEATTRFYSALNDLFKGEVEPMQQVWSHADDVTYMGPTGGRQVGWDQALAIWKKQADKRLGGKVKPEKLRIHVGSDLAIVSCFEVGENVVDGKPQEVSIRATNIFRKENGRWKMIGHHTDLLAFLKE